MGVKTLYSLANRPKILTQHSVSQTNKKELQQQIEEDKKVIQPETKEDYLNKGYEEKNGKLILQDEYLRTQKNGQIEKINYNKEIISYREDGTIERKEKYSRIGDNIVKLVKLENYARNGLKTFERKINYTTTGNKINREDKYYNHKKGEIKTNTKKYETKKIPEMPKTISKYKITIGNWTRRLSKLDILKKANEEKNKGPVKHYVYEGAPKGEHYEWRTLYNKVVDQEGKGTKFEIPKEEQKTMGVLERTDLDKYTPEGMAKQLSKENVMQRAYNYKLPRNLKEMYEQVEAIAKIKREKELKNYQAMLDYKLKQIKEISEMKINPEEMKLRLNKILNETSQIKNEMARKAIETKDKYSPYITNTTQIGKDLNITKKYLKDLDINLSYYKPKEFEDKYKLKDIGRIKPLYPGIRIVKQETENLYEKLEIERKFELMKKDLSAAEWQGLRELNVGIIPSFETTRLLIENKKIREKLEEKGYFEDKFKNTTFKTAVKEVGKEIIQPKNLMAMGAYTGGMAVFGRLTPIGPSGYSAADIVDTAIAVPDFARAIINPSPLNKAIAVYETADLAENFIPWSEMHFKAKFFLKTGELGVKIPKQKINQNSIATIERLVTPTKIEGTNLNSEYILKKFNQQIGKHPIQITYSEGKGVNNLILIGNKGYTRSRKSNKGNLEQIQTYSTKTGEIKEEINWKGKVLWTKTRTASKQDLGLFIKLKKESFEANEKEIRKERYLETKKDEYSQSQYYTEIPIGKGKIITGIVIGKEKKSLKAFKVKSEIKAWRNTIEQLYKKGVINVITKRRLMSERIVPEKLVITKGGKNEYEPGHITENYVSKGEVITIKTNNPIITSSITYNAKIPKQELEIIKKSKADKKTDEEEEEIAIGYTGTTDYTGTQIKPTIQSEFEVGTGPNTIGRQITEINIPSNKINQEITETMPFEEFKLQTERKLGSKYKTRYDTNIENLLKNSIINNQKLINQIKQQINTNTDLKTLYNTQINTDTQTNYETETNVKTDTKTRAKTKTDINVETNINFNEDININNRKKTRRNNEDKKKIKREQGGDKYALERYQDPWKRFTGKAKYSPLLNKLLRQRYGNVNL